MNGAKQFLKAILQLFIFGALVELANKMAASFESVV
jgi:hypothetical protein